jgi:hypothetical protein
MSEMHAPPNLHTAQPANFLRAIHDQDHYMIVYELAYAEHPIAVEALAKTFRASIRYLNGILSDLRRLGVAAKVSNRWVIVPWARETLHFLADYTKTITPEVPEPE